MFAFTWSGFLRTVIFHVFFLEQGENYLKTLFTNSIFCG